MKQMLYEPLITGKKVLYKLEKIFCRNVCSKINASVNSFFVNLASEIMAAWTVVVAQLAEWSLPTAEVCGSNRVIGIFYISC